MFRFRNDLCSILLVVVFLVIAGCTQQQNQSKIEEPIIKVKLENGDIKKLPIEEYVAGVVAGEMKQNWPKEAYAAQAIKARTFTMRRLEDKDNNLISARHQEAQAYKPQNITPIIKQAVRMTRGEVATYQGQYIKAWFHSSAGGETTTAKAGLNYKKKEPPYIKSIESPDDAAPQNIRSWQLTLTKKELLRVLQKTGERANQVIDIEVLDRDKTGRIVRVGIKHDKGVKKIHGADFRMAVGPDKLKSTLIESIKKLGDSFVLIGRGYGHGVGMSQWGAYKLARQGRSPEEIINYYFKEVKIIKKWD
ncbi:SpoIID/LytB domain-containing protein [Halanaerocella petrolearia]